MRRIDTAASPSASASAIAARTTDVALSAGGEGAARSHKGDRLVEDAMLVSLTGGATVYDMPLHRIGAQAAIEQGVAGYGDQPFWLMLIKICAVFVFLFVMVLFSIVWAWWRAIIVPAAAVIVLVVLPGAMIWQSNRARRRADRDVGEAGEARQPGAFPVPPMDLVVPIPPNRGHGDPLPGRSWVPEEASESR
jgi:hypothetical protein